MQRLNGTPLPPATNTPKSQSVRDPWHAFSADFNYVLYEFERLEEDRILDGRPEVILPGQQINSMGPAIYAPKR